MAHFGIICPPVPGHVDPMAAVSRTLTARGHRVTVFHVPDLEDKVRAEGLDFVSIGAERFPPGSLVDSVETLARLQGLDSLKFAIRQACRVSEAFLEEGPGAVDRAGIDLLLVDQNEPAGGSVAERLGLPFISTCTSLPLNREAGIPPPFAPWTYKGGLLAGLRNRLAYAVTDRLIAPIQATLNRQRQKWGLPPIRRPDDSFSPICQIAQMPCAFDFPREHLAAHFHYLGPWFDNQTARIPFPFERLDGRPLVYGSLGTLQPSRSPFFRVMADACGTLGVQLVLSLGKQDASSIGELPGDPIVVNYAPQIVLLSRAAAVITHSGMNTTLQALHFAVPLVAVPLAHDQPAIAARTAWTGAGIVIPPRQFTALRLREALLQLLDPASGYRAAAARMADASLRAGGRERAADFAEAVLNQGPVG